MSDTDGTTDSEAVTDDQDISTDDDISLSGDETDDDTTQVRNQTRFTHKHVLIPTCPPACRSPPSPGSSSDGCKHGLCTWCQRQTAI